MSGVTCHMLCVTCQMSRVMCHIFFNFFYKAVKLVRGGSVINGAYPLYFFSRHTTISMYMTNILLKKVCWIHKLDISNGKKKQKKSQIVRRTDKKEEEKGRRPSKELRAIPSRINTLKCAWINTEEKTIFNKYIYSSTMLYIKELSRYFNN